MRKRTFIAIFALLFLGLFFCKKSHPQTGKKANNKSIYRRTIINTQFFGGRDIQMTIYIPYRYTVQRLKNGKFKFNYLPVQDIADTEKASFVRLSGVGLGELNYNDCVGNINLDPSGNLSFDVCGPMEKKETSVSSNATKEYRTTTNKEIVRPKLNHITNYSAHGTCKLETIGSNNSPRYQITWTGYRYN
jgi:hypothetical protein